MSKKATDKHKHKHTVAFAKQQQILNPKTVHRTTSCNCTAFAGRLRRLRRPEHI